MKSLIFAPREGWAQQAACLGEDPKPWEPEAKRHQRAKALMTCQQCVVEMDCRVAAAEFEKDDPNNYVHGIRGGLVAQQRQRWIKQNRRELNLIFPDAVKHDDVMPRRWHENDDRGACA